jgi:hypothetical protein
MTTTIATATDDDVFRAFASGDALEGDTARAIVRHQPMDPHSEQTVTALFSHGVLLALRSEECVVFDAAPCKDGGRCVCAYMSAMGHAHERVREHYDESEVSRLDHGAFVELAGRLGVRA